jgi:hypothetical protein
VAGKIIVDTLDTDNSFITLNVQQATVATMNANGIFSRTGTKMIGTDGSIGNSSISGATVSGNLNFDATGTTGIRLPAANTLSFHTTGTEDMRIDANGNVGIGTSSPDYNLQVEGSGDRAIAITSTTSGDSRLWLGDTAAPFNGAVIYRNDSDSLAFNTVATERMRIDSSGRVGMGTTSPNTRLHVTGAGSGIFGVYDDVVKVKGASLGSYIHLEGTDSQSGVLLQANTDKGWFVGHDNSQGLKFSRLTSINQNGLTSAKDTGSPSMLLTADGFALFGTTGTNPAESNIKGTSFGQDGRVFFSAMGSEVMRVNRGTDDGVLIHFHQAGTPEGSISVSGTTVSYNGGHLSRYAQIANGNTNIILKGTVLSNLDEMNVYIDADGNPVTNEQLNKVKVSNTEGDANVAGVFVNWAYDEQHDIEEINMAMTGDMIIRIAEGVTVQRGDLLMSAGDGTAKPQDDDIVRSKTIAKVTSNHVTCTYEDGSYCVPCVLMAC